MKITLKSDPTAYKTKKNMKRKASMKTSKMNAVKRREVDIKCIRCI